MRLQPPVTRTTCFILLLAAFVVTDAGAGSARDVPTGFADLAAQLLPAVVNIASTENAPPNAQGAESGGADSGASDSGSDGSPGATSGGPLAQNAQSTQASGPSQSQAADLAPTDKLFQDFLNSPAGGGNSTGDGKSGTLQSLGSGFVIDPSGLIVTNNHVIDGATSISVILADGTSLPADLVGRDTQKDIALLRVHPDHPLVAVHFGISRATRIGDWVMAIGNPYGLGGTVTAGIISARGRDLDEDGTSDYIQTDAAINRGNSGGPLFDMAGEVVGINTAIYSPSGGSVGIGFAIPADDVAPVVQQLRRYGKPRRGWLGAQVLDVTPDIADALGLPVEGGAMIGTTAPGGPAALAHLRSGDVILGFNGHSVDNMKALPPLVAGSSVGEQAIVDYWRAGHRADVTLTIVDAPAEPTAPKAALPVTPAPPTVAAVAGLGLTLSDLSSDLLNKFSLPSDTHGVMITKVASNSAASRQGLVAGDIILQLGGVPVTRTRDLLARIDTMRQDKRTAILLLVQGSDETQWISLDVS
jgi:serine protease Do